MLSVTVTPFWDDKDLEEEFEHMSKDISTYQSNKLKRILEKNKDTEYLQRHGLQGRTDVESFRKCLPIISYSDIYSDIERIANGDQSSILCSAPFLRFSLSSGTSAGKPKLIPVYGECTEGAERWARLGSVFRNREFPPQPNTAALAFVYASKMHKTPGGHLAGTSTSGYFNSDQFKNRDRSKEAMVSPDEVILQGFDIRQSMYCHLLCGLIRRYEVNSVTSFFAYMIVEAMRMLENTWKDLCLDIRRGVLGSRITDSITREAVSKLLSANPKFAEILERDFSTGSWNGIIERIWPNAKSVVSVMTGAMAPYVPILRHYAGKIPLVSFEYGASECYPIGINLNPRTPPDQILFTIVPKCAYYEFLPVPQEGESEEYTETVAMNEVQIGKDYELVLTTDSGLYRYRLGDIMRVAGFYNTVPQVEYICRKNVLLSIATDKTDEAELQQVVEKASRLLEKTQMELLEFSSCADHGSNPGHYVIFWELKNGSELDDEVLDKCCELLDGSFNEPYQRGRLNRLIGPLELCIVKEGTFAQILEIAVSRGGSASQFKLPRCISNHSLLSLLASGKVKQYFSAQ